MITVAEDGSVVLDEQAIRKACMREAMRQGFISDPPPLIVHCRLVYRPLDDSDKFEAVLRVIQPANDGAP